MSTCRSCGCTDNRACPGGCYWVEPDLCSACVELAPFTAEDLEDAEDDLADAVVDSFIDGEIARTQDVAHAHSWLFTSATDAYCVHCGAIRPPELDAEVA